MEIQLHLPHGWQDPNYQTIFAAIPGSLAKSWITSRTAGIRNWYPYGMPLSQAWLNPLCHNAGSNEFLKLHCCQFRSEIGWIVNTLAWIWLELHLFFIYKAKSRKLSVKIISWNDTRASRKKKFLKMYLCFVSCSVFFSRGIPFNGKVSSSW